MNFVARYEMKPGELFFFCFVFLNECKVLSLSSFVSYVLEVTSKEATNLYYILEIIRGAMGDQAWVLPKLKTLTHCLWLVRVMETLLPSSGTYLNGTLASQ